jgi:hypothetical protein
MLDHLILCRFFRCSKLPRTKSKIEKVPNFLSFYFCLAISFVVVSVTNFLLKSIFHIFLLSSYLEFSIPKTVHITLFGVNQIKNNRLITGRSNPKPHRNLDYSVPAEEREKIGLGLLLPFAPIDSSSPFVSRSVKESSRVPSKWVNCMKTGRRDHSAQWDL